MTGSHYRDLQIYLVMPMAMRQRPSHGRTFWHSDPYITSGCNVASAHPAESAAADRRNLH